MITCCIWEVGKLSTGVLIIQWMDFLPRLHYHQMYFYNYLEAYWIAFEFATLNVISFSRIEWCSPKQAILPVTSELLIPCMLTHYTPTRRTGFCVSTIWIPWLLVAFCLTCLESQLEPCHFSFASSVIFTGNSTSNCRWIHLQIFKSAPALQYSSGRVILINPLLTCGF